MNVIRRKLDLLQSVVFVDETMAKEIEDFPLSCFSLTKTVRQWDEWQTVNKRLTDHYAFSSMTIPLNHKI